MAVVKAEAYGHGAAVTAACLQDAGVQAFAVATLEEGIALRRAGIRGEVLILGATPAARAWLIRPLAIDPDGGGPAPCAGARCCRRAYPGAAEDRYRHAPSGFCRRGYGGGAGRTAG